MKIIKSLSVVLILFFTAACSKSKDGSNGANGKDGLMGPTGPAGPGSGQTVTHTTTGSISPNQTTTEPVPGFNINNGDFANVYMSNDNGTTYSQLGTQLNINPGWYALGTGQITLTNNMGTNCLWVITVVIHQ